LAELSVLRRMTQLCSDLDADGHTRLFTGSSLPICFASRAKGKVNGAERLNSSNSAWSVPWLPLQIENLPPARTHYFASLSVAVT
jgi:hypothetical protein